MSNANAPAPQCADCGRAVPIGSGYCRECAECDSPFCLCQHCHQERDGTWAEQLCPACAVRLLATAVR